MNRPHPLSIIGTPAKRRSVACDGFTLIEILAASLAAAMILTAIYGIFSKAIRMRDNATERTRESGLRERAATVIRNDLRNAFVSGGPLAAALQGSTNNPESRFPGYLKLTTTTAKDSPDELMGDIQQVEYYIAEDPEAASPDGGVLVRRIDRNLLAETREPGREESILSGVASLEVAFFDGENWFDTWEINETTTTVPEAIRVRIESASSDDQPAPRPIDVLVPWTTQAQTEVAASADDAVSPTPTPTPTPSPTPPGGPDENEGGPPGPDNGPRA